MYIYIFIIYICLYLYLYCICMVRVFGLIDHVYVLNFFFQICWVRLLILKGPPGSGKVQPGEGGDLRTKCQKNKG